MRWQVLLVLVLIPYLPPPFHYLGRDISQTLHCSCLVPCAATGHMSRAISDDISALALDVSLSRHLNGNHWACTLPTAPSSSYLARRLHLSTSMLGLINCFSTQGPPKGSCCISQPHQQRGDSGVFIVTQQTTRYTKL